MVRCNDLDVTGVKFMYGDENTSAVLKSCEVHELKKRWLDRATFGVVMVRVRT